MKSKYVINGYFLTQRITGLQRMGYETLICLDKLTADIDIELLVPDNCPSLIPDLQNIEIVRLGDRTNRWNTKVAGLYAKRNNRKIINLVNSYSTVRHSIVMIGDLRILEKIDGRYTDKFKFRVKTLIQTVIGVICSDRIATISEFSKERIIHFLHINPEKIEVIPCAWQHFEKIKTDYRVFEKFSTLQRENYYFSLGSKAPHKNHKWIVEVAKNNPSETFVVTGGENNIAWNNSGLDNETNNIIFTGYLSDGEVKALLSECKAFLFPSLYEGFGIPPMEAMSVGAKCIVSDIRVMHEIYGESVYYIDPHNYDIDLKGILEGELKASSSEVLDKYSWKKAAEVWTKLIEEQL